MTTTERDPRRKRYEKPLLKSIEMKEEEVLAAGCKLIGGVSDVGHDNCGIFNNCNQTGS
jgi:hypothetical protein